MNEPVRRDLARITLAVLCIGGLIAASFWILQPFVPAIIWAAMVVVATWPVMLAVQARLHGRRWAAVMVMTLILLLVLIIPLGLAIGTIVDNADRLGEWAKAIETFRLPSPPDWLVRLPMIGDQLLALWQRFAMAGVEELATAAAPYAQNVTKWFVGQVGSIGLLFLTFLLTVFFAAVMYASGEAAATVALRIGHRLAGERGENSVRLAGQAIRGVALGVGVTAIVQSVLGGIGLAIAGIPFAPVLTAIMFMLCIAQIGPVVVLVPAVIWIWWNGSTGWGIFLLVWTLIVGSLDNVLRPILIKRGADLPLLLILVGVIGGLVAFGLVGIFVGPVVLAVTYKLLGDWLDDDRRQTAPVLAPLEAPGGVPEDTPP